VAAAITMPYSAACFPPAYLRGLSNEFGTFPRDAVLRHDSAVLYFADIVGLDFAILSKKTHAGTGESPMLGKLNTWNRRCSTQDGHARAAGQWPITSKSRKSAAKSYSPGIGRSQQTQFES
jgi:hypothetical protein